MKNDFTSNNNGRKSFYTELGGSGGLGSEAHGLGYSAKKVELTSFPQQPRIPQGVCHHAALN